jgi:hypothetical protein
MERVYCEVGTRLSIQLPYTSDFNGRATVQAVSLRPLTTRPGFDPRSVHVRFVVKSENYEQSTALSAIGKHCTEKHLHHIFQISVG